MLERSRDPLSILRREMAKLGYPIDNLTDEQINRVRFEFTKILTSQGFTEEQARYVLRELNPSSGL